MYILMHTQVHHIYGQTATSNYLLKIAARHKCTIWTYLKSALVLFRLVSQQVYYSADDDIVFKCWNFHAFTAIGQIGQIKKTDKCKWDFFDDEFS